MDPDRISQNLAAVDSHFHSEAQSEVETALEAYTDDIVWDAPALNGLNRCFSGKQAVAENYRKLFASMRNVRFQLLQRFATEDRVVDDSFVTFDVAADGYWQFPLGSHVEMRLVHIFEMRGTRIAKELVFDMGRVVKPSRVLSELPLAWTDPLTDRRIAEEPGGGQRVPSTRPTP